MRRACAALATALVLAFVLIGSLGQSRQENPAQPKKLGRACAGADGSS